ncbi:AAA family ATPase [Micromonospora chersina]|uniref:AAA family ATPase n=1 Tax=Micromonospora chersina TaxID=47854 RepID=UPI003D8F6BD3
MGLAGRERRILGVGIREYKNLSDVWLPWSEKLAIFGANGSGKTNVLECLALLMGTDETIRLARRRLERPKPDALSVILAGVPAPLLPPARSLRHHDWLVERVEAAGHDYPDQARRLLEGFVVGGQWWQAMGVRDGDSVEDGLMRAGVPQKAATLVDELLRTAVIRFDLESINLDATMPSGSVARRFHRTLMVQELMEDLIRVADALPDVFAPFRRALADPESCQGGWVPLLTLPPASDVPVALQWLARARTDAEIEADLAAALQRYEGPGSKLIELIGQRLLFQQLDEEPVHVVIDTLDVRIEEELELTAPGVEISGTNDNEFTATRRLQPTWLGRIIGETGTSLILDGLSAGERRWADEAISTGIRAVDNKVLLTRVLISVLDQLDEYSCMEVGLTIAEHVDKAIEDGGVWLPFALDDLFERAVKAVGSAAPLSDPGRLAFELAVYAVGASKLVVRVFDEPEAHLHPAAQRRLVTALDKLVGEATNIMISSHSPIFLDMPGYVQAHVDNSEGLSRIDVLGSADVKARDALAQQLGITGGELFAGIGALLIVEGEHDRLILETLYGKDLRSAGVAVVRMHGTDNLLATAELDFIDRYLDVPIVILVDNARVDRVEDGRVHDDRLSDEERKLRDLRKKRRGRKKHKLFGLERPDITAYLNETAVRQIHPGFSGWGKVLRELNALNYRPKFKDWVWERHATDLRHSKQIRQVLEEMTNRDLPPVGELTRVVKEIVAFVGGQKTTGGEAA